MNRMTNNLMTIESEFLQIIIINSDSLIIQLKFFGPLFIVLYIQLFLFQIKLF